MAAAFDSMVDELQKALDRSRASEAATRKFLADASHELRTPIARLQATAETLLREQPVRPDRDALEARLAGDAARLGRLVADLLDLARLDGAAGERAGDVDLQLVTRAALDEAASDAGRVRRRRGVRHGPTRARRRPGAGAGAAQHARQRCRGHGAGWPHPRDARGTASRGARAGRGRRPRGAAGRAGADLRPVRAARPERRAGLAPGSAWRSPARSPVSTAATCAATTSSAARHSPWCSRPPAADFGGRRAVPQPANTALPSRSSEAQKTAHLVPGSPTGSPTARNFGSHKRSPSKTQWSSRPAGRRNPALGRFNSCAASSEARSHAVTAFLHRPPDPP